MSECLYFSMDFYFSTLQQYFTGKALYINVQ